MQYVGIDWAYRRAAWCAKRADGTIAGEGFVARMRLALLLSIVPRGRLNHLLPRAS
jgi:hypothetical protein